MSRGLTISRRAALKLTARGGAGLVASACTDGARPMPEGSVRPAPAEQAPRNLLGACIAHDDEGGTGHPGAQAGPPVAGDRPGRSAFAYRRGTIDVVVLVAERATARFGPPVRVTSRPFDPAQGTLSGKHGAWWIGDYQGLASALGRIHPFWNDPRSGRLEIFTLGPVRIGRLHRGGRRA
jgi:hypothetical protein